MSLARHLLASAIFAAVFGGLSIPALASDNISAVFALMLVPCFVPLAVLALGTRDARWWWATATPLAACWGYVAYCYSQPYTGGGVNFAVLIGWAASAAATVFALCVTLVGLLRGRACLRNSGTDKVA